MSSSSILGGSAAARQADGKEVDRLGPSDTSDSGSDVQGERAMSPAPDNPGEWGAVVSDGATDTDAGGTGERAGAGAEQVIDGADVLPDRVVSASGEDLSDVSDVEALDAVSGDEDDLDADDADDAASSARRHG